MTAPVRIGALHALAGSIDPTQAAFSRAWPEADVAHLMDGSLYLDRSRGTADTDEITRRIDRLIQHSAGCGVDGILFTGSFFGGSVRAVREKVSVPVLTSFEGIIETALCLEQPLGVLSTAPDSTTLLVEELEAAAAERDVPLSITGDVVPGAMDALVAGRYDEHDRLVLEAIGNRDDGRAVVLAQFSMERVIDQARGAVSVPVLGPATEAASRLREIVGN